MNDQRFKFTQDSQYGTLVYTLQTGEQLLRFDHCMMINNNVTGILGYAVENSTSGVSLTYNILRGTRLSLLKNRVMSGQYLITVLLGIANVLLTSEQYMLKENKFVFNEDCIFVDTGTGAVNLVYIPTTGYTGATFAQFVRYFITNGSINYGEDAGCIMSLLNFINTNPNASADEIKSFLEREQMKNTKSGNPVQAAPQTMQAAAVPQARAAQPVQQYQPAPKPAPQPVPAVLPSSEKVSAEKNASEKNGLLSKMFGGHKSKSEPTSGGAIAGMNIPGMPQSAPDGAMAGMNVPGMSPPASGGAMAGMNIPGMPQPVQQKSAPEKKQTEKKKLFRKEAVPVSSPVNVPSSASAANIPRTEIPEIAIEADNQSQETVLLNQGSYARGITQRAYLIGKNGERVAITASGFTVGKENTSGISNDYTIKNASVSRNHAMFEIKNGRYYVVDMTSLNGTFVNGNRINSNINVEVKNGDTIVFANAEYKFVIE
ncbi:MAG: FHA domain-containing protein [Oscillospiraceae bacterium]